MRAFCLSRGLGDVNKSQPVVCAQALGQQRHVAGAWQRGHQQQAREGEHIQLKPHGPGYEGAYKYAAYTHLTMPTIHPV